MPRPAPLLNGGLNWGWVFNGGVLALGVIGYLFATFRDPLNDKFTNLDKGLSAQAQLNSQRIDSLRSELIAQIEMERRASDLALGTVKATNDEIEKSLERRFKAQDEGNNQLQRQMDARFGRIDREHEDSKIEFRNLLADIERRRAEIATRADLSATRIELLSEIKRVDQIAAAAAGSAMPREEFKTWMHEHDVGREWEYKRVEWLAQRLQDHERDERSEKADAPIPPRKQ